MRQPRVPMKGESLANNPGTWPVRDPRWEVPGMATVLRYAGKKAGPPRAWVPQPLPAGAEAFPRYQGLVAGVPGRFPGSFDREYELTIRGRCKFSAIPTFDG